jgi:AcrR family transcriptional regulator
MKFTPRQTEIINAATELIGEGGVQNLTTKKLAAKMNFSEPALYRHFKDKNDILRSILLYFKGNMGEGLKQVLLENKTGLDKIMDIISYQFNFFMKFPAVIMVIFSETSFQGEKKLSITVKNIVDDKKKIIEDILLSGQKDKSIRGDISIDQLTNLIMGSMRISVLNWRLHGFEFNLLREGEELQKTIEILLKN